VRAVALLPGMVTVVIPATLLYLTGADTFGVWESVPTARVILPIIGLLLIGIGLSLMAATIRLFVTIGKGTLAPWNPTERLVVQGVYRYVRNPMISGVFFVLLGEALTAASLPLACWFLVFVVVNAIYIPLVEEPGLAKRFGEEYLAFGRIEVLIDNLGDFVEVVLGLGELGLIHWRIPRRPVIAPAYCRLHEFAKQPSSALSALGQPP
jgi:protein-S-isoprenylcysteine O-methyltransferase Ste14